KSAVLYENIDSLTFTPTGSIENNDYALTATKDNYTYNIACPSIYSDNYTLERLDNGKCKFILSSGYVYKGFGETESGETDIPTYIKIGDKLFTTDFTNLPKNISATEDNGTLTITLNNYNSADSLFVCAPNGVEIALKGNNYICYETAQKSVYSPVNVTFLGSGNLYSGVIETAELTINNSSLNISTGGTVGNGYALKTAFTSSAAIEINTKLSHAIELTGSSAIKSGEINIYNAATGIFGNYTFMVKDHLKITDCKYGIIVSKVDIQESAICAITNIKTAIIAKTLTLSGKLTIKDTTESAIILSDTSAAITFTAASVLTISSTNKIETAAIKMSQFADLLTINGEIIIFNYTYGFYTEANGKYKAETDNFTFNDKYYGYRKSSALKGFSLSEY
ncbi:MAG TPA: hypothetical protein DDY77_02895, partial [Clostridiales bacterium]|nr:hypothetical protein [Clostridiales bacterium]